MRSVIEVIVIAAGFFFSPFFELPLPPCRSRTS